MKPFRLVIPLSMIAMFAIGQDVRYNYANQDDFSKYRTYRWVQIKGAEQTDQITDQQIKTSFEEELAKRGLTKSDGENADLLIGYQVSLGTEKQITMYDTGWGYG